MRMQESMIAFNERQFADQVAAVKAGTSTHIWFYSTTDADGQLVRLEPLPGLHVINFEAMGVSKAGLQHLIRQPNLRHLSFQGAPKLESTAMDAVAALPNLESLTLDYTGVGDAGVQTVSMIPTLRTLKLSYDGRGSARCPLSDAAIDALAKCSQLRHLTLEGEWFSENAAERLRLVLPECEIEVVRFEKKRTKRLEAPDKVITRCHAPRSTAADSNDRKHHFPVEPKINAYWAQSLHAGFQ
jgi:hypothetical protein